jgi:hypothetical protein
MHAGIECIAASMLGNAENRAGNGSCAMDEGGPGPAITRGQGVDVACVAVSATGNSTNAVGSGCADGDSHDVIDIIEENSLPLEVLLGCIAVAPAGNATNSNNATYFGCGSMSAEDGISSADGCLAIGGIASNRASGQYSCGSRAGGETGTSLGCLSIGLQGASNDDEGQWSCGWAEETGPSSLTAGCISLTAAGPAQNSAQSGCGMYDTFNAALGCIAVSAVGSATNHAQRDGCGFYEATSFQGIDIFPGGPAVGCLAIASLGDASNSAGDSSCGAWNGGPNLLDVACVAISGGNATNYAGNNSCGTWAAEGEATGQVTCVALGSSARNRAGSDSCDYEYFSGQPAVVGDCLAFGYQASSNAWGPNSCGTHSADSVGAVCMSESPAGILVQSGHTALLQREGRGDQAGEENSANPRFESFQGLLP